MNNIIAYWVIPSLLTLIFIVSYAFINGLGIIVRGTRLADTCVLLVCVVIYPIGIIAMILRIYDDRMFNNVYKSRRNVLLKEKT